LPKQVLRISGKTILEHSIEICERDKLIDKVVVVTHRQFVDFCRKISRQNNYRKVHKMLIGGETQQQSSSIGISAIEEQEAKVLAHDSVRPLLPDRRIDECVRALDKYDAIDVAIPATDTLIKMNEDMTTEDIPMRRFLCAGKPRRYLN
jgi:2-C-methyl-D-erythritol 4-phosphate cytidylyltransferase